MGSSTRCSPTVGVVPTLRVSAGQQRAGQGAAQERSWGPAPGAVEEKAPRAQRLQPPD